MKPFFEIVAPDLIGRVEKISAFFGSISRIGAIALFPFVISKHPMNEATRVHEATHIYQQLMLPIPIAIAFIMLAITVNPLFALGLLWCWAPYIGPFYIVYGLEYLIRFAYYRNGSVAYKMISFEQQAYNTTVVSGADWNPLGWIRAMFVW